MELKMEMEMQWNPSIKATQDGGLSKEVAFMRGKINMICKEWCMEMASNFATLVRLSQTFHRGSTVLELELKTMCGWNWNFTIVAASFYS